LFQHRMIEFIFGTGKQVRLNQFIVLLCQNFIQLYFPQTDRDTPSVQKLAIFIFGTQNRVKSRIKFNLIKKI
jgi:hypothetical protein